MTMGIIEATTSAIGEELNMLFGFSVTRLTAQALAEQIYQSGLNTMNYDGNVTCTLTAGAFLTGVVNGMRLRILSGVAAGLEALVSLRNSGTQITLQSPILGASSFTGASWELVIDATTTLN